MSDNSKLQKKIDKCLASKMRFVEDLNKLLDKYESQSNTRQSLDSRHVQSPQYALFNDDTEYEDEIDDTFNLSSSINRAFVSNLGGIRNTIDNTINHTSFGSDCSKHSSPKQSTIKPRRSLHTYTTSRKQVTRAPKKYVKYSTSNPSISINKVIFNNLNDSSANNRSVMTEEHSSTLSSLGSVVRRKSSNVNSRSGSMVWTTRIASISIAILLFFLFIIFLLLFIAVNIEISSKGRFI